MSDQLACEHVDPWISLERTVGEFGSSLVDSSLRQILTDLAHLILDDVMVVAQPLLGRHRLRIVAGDSGQKA